MGSLQHISAMTSGFSPWEIGEKGQLYVDTRINGIVREVLLNTRASHNFIDPNEDVNLGLKIVEGGEKMKAVNSATVDAKGVAKNVLLKVGKWPSSVDFTVVPLDDYKVVLGLEFFKKDNVTLSLASKQLSLYDRQRIRMVPLMVKKLPETNVMSALCMIKGCTKRRRRSRKPHATRALVSRVGEGVTCRKNGPTNHSTSALDSYSIAKEGSRKRGNIVVKPGQRMCHGIVQGCPSHQATPQTKTCALVAA